MAAFKSLVIDVPTLSEALQSGAAGITLLDVRPDEAYDTGHITNAHLLRPGLLNHAEPPRGGLLPAQIAVQHWTSQLGLSTDSTLVVYDDGKATAAARALWVLHAYGFTNVHWLNGGLSAWVKEGHPITNAAPEKPEPNSSLKLSLNSPMVLNTDELKANLELDEDAPQKRKPIDARTAGEFAGTDVRSARGGHMPGAVHYEWLDLFTDAGTLKPEAELKSTIKALGLTAAEPCVVYCQSHQRSAVTYVVLKHLGFEDVAALDGAWSTWGNDPNTPIEL